MSLIVCEDEHLLVVNKPAGWNTHAPSPYAGEGIYEWLRHREPRWANLAILHRLDKETSGVLVFGKTPVANKSLTEQFTARSVHKRYLLMTDRAVHERGFTVVSHLRRAGEKYVSVPLQPGQERAETRFTLVRSEARNTLLAAEPVTGRTHQIRVHAAERGLPILGDALYGGTKAARVFLHAREISFQHPVTREVISLVAEPDWAAACEGLRDAAINLSDTDAYRLIHGASDGWPGLYVEKLGDFLLAQSELELAREQRALLEALASRHGARGVYHKLLNRNVRRTAVADASPRLVFGDGMPDRFSVRENGLKFQLSFTEGYSVGLFLDQRDNRRRLLTRHVAAGFPLFTGGAPTVLNTFAYTCGFSVAAAKGGAITTSLDLSKKYLEWGQRNFALNDLDPAQHDFIYGDVFDWMKRLMKKGRAFDCILLDPPTFSQSKEGGTWQAEKHYGRLVDAALPLLKREGVLFASTNAARLEPAAFVEVIRASIAAARRKVVQQHYVPQPPDFPISREEPAYLKTVWLRVQ